MIFVQASLILCSALIFGCGFLKAGHGVSAGDAMAPTIAVGDHFGYAGFGVEEISRFDIVAYTRKPDARRGIDENTLFISRIVGLPGETVELRNGKVVISGSELDESVFPKIADTDNRKAFVVPEQSYFILGDNRPNSEDSRYIGPVERKKIVGIVSNIIRQADYEAGKRW